MREHSAHRSIRIAAAIPLYEKPVFVAALPHIPLAPRRQITSSPRPLPGPPRPRPAHSHAASDVPRSLPTRSDIHGSSPARPLAPTTPGSRPLAISPHPQSGTSGSLLSHTGPPQTAPPSAPLASDTPAPLLRRQYRVQTVRQRVLDPTFCSAHRSARYR